MEQKACPAGSSQAGVKSAKLYVERDQIERLSLSQEVQSLGRSQEGFGNKTSRGITTSLYFGQKLR